MGEIPGRKGGEAVAFWLPSDHFTMTSRWLLICMFVLQTVASTTGRPTSNSHPFNTYHECSVFEPSTSGRLRLWEWWPVGGRSCFQWQMYKIREDSKRQWKKWWHNTFITSHKLSTVIPPWFKFTLYTTINNKVGNTNNVCSSQIRQLWSSMLNLWLRDIHQWVFWSEALLLSGVWKVGV